jgi:hypothetical protein
VVSPDRCQDGDEDGDTEHRAGRRKERAPERATSTIPPTIATTLSEPHPQRRALHDAQSDGIGALTLAQLYVVALVSGVLTVFFNVAYQFYLPSLIGLDDVVEGNARLTASAQVARVAGLSLAGGVVQALGGPGAVVRTRWYR